MKKLPLFLLLLALAATTAGCSFAPDYARPAMEVPVAWAPDTAQPLDVAWWQRFADPTLNALVEEALTYNRTVDIAMARVDQARAYLGLARSQQFPVLTGSAFGAQAQTSADSVALARSLGVLSQAVTGLPAPDVSRVGEQWSATLQAVWEVDLWGKYRNSTASAREQLLATEAAQKGALLGLAGQTTIGYFTLRNYDSQLAIAERTLKSRLEALDIYRARFEEGLISELDFLRAKTEVDTMRANVYTLQYQVANAESALLTLVGRSPRAIMEDSPQRGLSLESIPAVIQPPAGLPSELLERRPDILAAEARLRAANFQIGTAKAAWFPSISLSGLLGAQSLELDKLFQPGSDIWNYGVNLHVPLLSFGRISNNVKVSEAIMREAAASYVHTVQQAFREIRDALVIQARTVDIANTLSAAVGNLNRAVELATLRYENGYASYLEVLDAERSLFEAEISLANVRANHLNAIVQVCMALGGGWAQ